MTDNHFFVVSCFGDGELEKSTFLKKGWCHLYKKGDRCDHHMANDLRVSYIDNVGYNMYSYMKFIVDNYDALPEFMVFCKNNVFPRHVRRDVFVDQAFRKVFTCIEDPSTWDLKYPNAMLSSDNGFMELNTSWYTNYHPTRYFSDFNEFYQFIFEHKNPPRYLRFAPGGNYTVPREHVLLRSRSFYKNLMNFVSHHQFSGESHMLERALYIIWNSTVRESIEMKTPLGEQELLELKRMSDGKNISPVRRARLRSYTELTRVVDFSTGRLFD